MKQNNMNSVAVEKIKNIKFLYKTLYIKIWRFEFRVYCKWDFLGRRFTYMNTGKMGGRKGFVLYFFPFAISYQVYK